MKIRITEEANMYHGCDAVIATANLEGCTMKVASITSPTPGTT